MASPINPQLLTLDTALETCRPSPVGEKCVICQEIVSNVPPNYKAAAAHEAKPEAKSEQPAIGANDATDIEAVKTKVCGDMHFFHRICIMSWFKSTTPYLNTCPIDRKVLFGTHLVPQRATNLPTFAAFPGHTIEAHYANGRNILDRTFVNLYDLYEQLQRENIELDHEMLQAAAALVNNASRGRQFEDVADAEVGEYRDYL
ncbi:Nn.00g032820.m01.CDS01 [Neocucurbitaria sp. VM-36]